MRLLVVVPAFNEEQALPRVLEELRATIAEHQLAAEILVIDDGSTDHTSEVALSNGARVVRLSRNLGIGGAVQCGLRVALRDGFDYAVQVDGDGQHLASEIPKLIAAAKEADLVVGTRYRERAGFRSTLLRRIGSWWLKILLRVLGLRVTDPTSGFRLYGSRALMLFDQTYPYDYPEPEALALARAARLSVIETPVTMRERQGGQSSIAGLRAPYYMIKVTLAVLLAYWRNRTRNGGS